MSESKLYWWSVKDRSGECFRINAELAYPDKGSLVLMAGEDIVAEFTNWASYYREDSSVCYGRIDVPNGSVYPNGPLPKVEPQEDVHQDDAPPEPEDVIEKMTGGKYRSFSTGERIMAGDLYSYELVHTPAEDYDAAPAAGVADWEEVPIGDQELIGRSPDEFDRMAFCKRVNNPFDDIRVGIDGRRWRLLGPDEVVQDGDWINSKSNPPASSWPLALPPRGGWVPVRHAIGVIVNPSNDTPEFIREVK